MDLSNYFAYEGLPKIENPEGVSQDFFQFMRSRRTVREFSSRPVPDEVIFNAVQAAGCAPSGANRQPWYFVVVKSPEVKRAIRVAAEEVERGFYANRASEHWLEALKPFGTDANKDYLEDAPVLILIFSVTREIDAAGAEKINYYPIESTGIATGILITALHNAGVASLTHTPKPARFLNEIVGLNKNYRPFLILVAGYPKTPVMVPKIQRKSFAEICRIV